MFPYGLQNHTWCRLPTIAPASEAGNLGTGMMRTVVDTGQWRSGFPEALAHPAGYILKCLFIVVSVRDTGLVGHYDQLISRHMKAAASSQDAGNELKVGYAMDIPGIDVDHTIAIQENGRCSGDRCHGPLNSRRARSKSSGTPISIK